MGRGRPKKQLAAAEQPDEQRGIPAVSISEAAEPQPSELNLTGEIHEHTHASEPEKSTAASPQDGPQHEPNSTFSQDETSSMSEEQEKISGTVTIGCKLPCGLVMSYKGKSVELKGSRDSRILNGYGLTPNVDEEFWEAWKKAHAKMPFVKGELVFAYTDKKSAEDMAAEREKERTGFEGMDPDKPGKDLEKVPEDQDED